MSHPISRSHTIDLLRGYLLIVIMIDHLGRFPSSFELLTGRGALWVTAAEGFFFLSGMMVGLTRARKIPEQGSWVITKKLWRRSFVLYTWSTSLTLAFTACSFLLGWAPKGGLTTLHDWPSIVWQTVTLQYAYGWTDFLPRYAIYMAIAPIAAMCIAHGWWLTVVAVSALVWGVQGDHFNLAWQLLFFVGIVVGYYLPVWQQKIMAWPKHRRDHIYHTLVGATLITLTVSATINLLLPAAAEWLATTMPGVFVWQFLPFTHLIPEWQQTLAPSAALFDHDHLAVGRLASFALWYTTLYLTIRRRESWFVQHLGALLLPLGRSSLETYIIHGIALYAVAVLLPSATSSLANFCITITTIGSVWWLATQRARLQRMFLCGLAPLISHLMHTLGHLPDARANPVRASLLPLSLLGVGALVLQFFHTLP